MRRGTLLRRLSDEHKRGRTFDFDCNCYEWRHGWMESTPEYLPRVDCPACHGSGSVSKRLSRREAHAVITFNQMTEKYCARAMQAYVQEQRLSLKREARVHCGDW